MTTAKRYIGCYKHYKGTKATADSKPEIKGLEYKRGDSVRFARQMQEEVVNLLVGFKQDASDDPEDFEEVLDRWKDRILDEPVDLADVMVSQRLGKNLSDYKRRKKKDSEDWARQQPHIEIARLLEGRGADVREGSKIEYVVTDGSTKPLTVIPAEDWPGDCDRFALWDALVAPPTLRLLEAAFPDHPWGPWVRTRPQKARKACKAKKKVA
jgi:DNA polymerase elongation subunit (family B)